MKKFKLKEGVGVRIRRTIQTRICGIHGLNGKITRIEKDGTFWGTISLYHMPAPFHLCREDFKVIKKKASV